MKKFLKFASCGLVIYILIDYFVSAFNCKIPRMTTHDLCFYSVVDLVLAIFYSILILLFFNIKNTGAKHITALVFLVLTGANSVMISKGLSRSAFSHNLYTFLICSFPFLYLGYFSYINAKNNKKRPVAAFFTYLVPIIFLSVIVCFMEGTCFSMMGRREISAILNDTEYGFNLIRYFGTLFAFIGIIKNSKKCFNKDAAGVIKYITLITGALWLNTAVISCLPVSWNISFVGAYFDKIPMKSDIALFFLLFGRFIFALPLIITSIAIKQKWSKYLDWFFNKLLLPTIFLIIVSFIFKFILVWHPSISLKTIDPNTGKLACFLFMTSYKFCYSIVMLINSLNGYGLISIYIPILINNIIRLFKTINNKIKKLSKKS